MSRTTPSILRHAAAVVALTAAAGWSLAASATPPPGASAGQHAALHEARAIVPMGGPGMGRMLDAVGASPEQRERIETIAQGARSDLAGGRDDARALREQALALFAQPAVDAQAAEALRQQMLDRFDSRSARMTQAMLDIGEVLTPAQRQQWTRVVKAERAAMPHRTRAHHRPDTGPAGR